MYMNIYWKIKAFLSNDAMNAMNAKKNVYHSRIIDVVYENLD